ncbi:MAG: phosphatidate cytidylyltransferase [Alphaproteobacteria bacterium]|nr:phosphatidate cytidylyltransferase [Alphaproteobacteria bacterium]
MGELPRRVLSALVVAPPAVLAVWAGAPYFGALVLAAVLILAWEWDRMCDGRFGPAGIVLALSVAAAAVLAWLSAWTWGLAAAAAGFGAVLAVERLARGKAAFWAAFGALYIGVPAVAILWLRDDPVAGRASVLWLIAVTAATDIGAYFSGRAVGGPKLAPRVSPGKTWAGLLGGVVAAGAAGAAGGWLMDGSLGVLAGAGVMLAFVGQAGDLFESAAKRRFGRKDMSGLIPGHGGLFDRVDGLVIVILAVAAATLLIGAPVVQW